MALKVGDILVTKSRGHTVAVVESSYNREETKTEEYYPKYNGTSDSIVDALTSLKISASKENRKKIAVANGISDYEGTAKQNLIMLALLKKGKLKK